MRDDDFIWNLMARAIYGEATASEKQALQEYLAKNPELQQQFELLHQLLSRSAGSGHATQDDYTEQVRVLLAKTGSPISPMTAVPRNVRRKWFYYGAAAAAVIALAYWSMTQMHVPASRGIQRDRYPLALAAPKGARKQLLLPDGSKVWLNGGSRLFYVTDFKSRTREVKLEGEAFFDVAHAYTTDGVKRPFIVHAGNIDIKVLGTAFNVKAYTNEAVTTAVLYRGLISVTKHDGERNFQPVLLYPNQKLMIPNALVAENPATGTPPEAIKIEAIDSTKAEEARVETAWMYNRLEFRGDDFVTLVHKMEQWYNVTIHFTDEAVKRLRFNGSFEKETMAQALEALRLATPFNYKIENNEVFISSAR
ncbi:FecR family protein [Niabella sp. CC-SYL272]|uniref:FecR family protein n=1 Tax=Niabella agricola TaxID=2891571 RepID=UPI001F1BB738|nr:FecR domain-containing protein [Niabella agricola]MCF3110815.1 FecR family protein [Niabella agricola]